MLDDFTESIAEVIYVNEMDRASVEVYEVWDLLSENVQEPYLQTAEEIIDLIHSEGCLLTES
jgi:hypothetical protein